MSVGKANACWYKLVNMTKRVSGQTLKVNRKMASPGRSGRILLSEMTTVKQEIVSMHNLSNRAYSAGFILVCLLLSSQPTALSHNIRDKQKAGIPTTILEATGTKREQLLLAQFPSEPSRRILPQDSTQSSGGSVSAEKIKAVVEIMLRRNWKTIPGPDGPETVVHFKIMGNGQVGEISINRSAGNATFDQASVSAVKSVGPFPPLPPYLGMENIPMVASFHSGKQPFMEVSLSGGAPTGLANPPVTPQQTASAGSLPTSQPTPTKNHPPAHQGSSPAAHQATPSHQTSSEPPRSSGQTPSGPAGANLNDRLLSLNNQAVIAINDSNYEVAIQKLEEALKIDPSYRTAQSNLAIAYNNYGLQLRERPKDAIKIFHKALALDPTNDKTKTNLETVIAYLGKDAKSFNDRVALAELAMSEGDRVGAKLEYEAALALKPDPETQQKLQILLSGAPPSVPAAAQTDGPPPAGDPKAHSPAKTKGPAVSANKPPKSTPKVAKSPQSDTEPDTESGANTKGGGGVGPGGEKLDTIYRNLNSLEQRAFSKTFESDDILSRIARLEKKMLGKVQSGKPLRRVDTLLMAQ